MVDGHLISDHWLRVAVACWATAGPVLFAALLGVGWWTARRQRTAVMAAAIWTPIGVVTAIAINQPIEQASSVRLPFFHGMAARTAALPEPSDHMAMAAATVAGLLLVRRVLGLLAAGAGVLMALAFALGGAPVDDLLGGGVVGVTVTSIGFVLFEGPIRRLVARARSTRLRPIAGVGKAS